MPKSTAKDIVTSAPEKGGRRLSHEEAAELIIQAGDNHATTPDRAKALLKRVGILDASGVLAESYR